MAKRKKSGNARSGASQSKSRQDGRIRITANSGTEPDERHSTTTSLLELSASAKRIAGKNSEPTRENSSPLISKTSPTALTRMKIYLFKISDPYYSTARREWRIECYEKWGPTFQQEKEAFISFDTRTEATEAWDSLKEVKTWKDWEGITSAIRRART